MIIGILQTDIHWASPIDNQASAERLMQSLGHVDLLVLPETWNTGFMTGGKAPDYEDSLRWMQRVAQARNTAVCGSMAVSDGAQKQRNRLFFVYPDGHYLCYDKRHLFAYGGEDRHFSHGQERVIVEYRGMRFLLAVCYDLRFPVWLRNNGDYDALLIVANWPESRKRVWTTLLQARAIENQCFVMACNRVGDDPVCHYAGGSMLIDAKGRIVAQDKGGEEAVCAEVDLEELMLFRKKFPVLADRDGFTLDM